MLRVIRKKSTTNGRGGGGTKPWKSLSYTGCAPILTAKVPIIQFRDVESKLDCDLCYGNTLAIDNSNLLKEYCLFDPRFKELAGDNLPADTENLREDTGGLLRPLRRGDEATHQVLRGGHQTAWRPAALAFC